MKFSRHIIFYCFLFFPGSYSTLGQNTIDSLSAVIDRADKYALPELHKKAGIIYYRERNFSKAQMAFQACVNAAQNINDWVMAGNCFNNLGGVAFQQGDYVNGILFYRKAIEVYRQNHQDTLLGDGFLNLGLAFKRLNIFDSATVNFYKGVQILEDTGSKTGLMRGYNMLGNILREVNSPEKARLYYMKSLDMAKSLNHVLQIAKTYNNLGTLFRQRGVLDSAVTFYRKSLVLKKDKDVPRLTGNSYYNLAITFIDLQKNDSAIHHLKKSNEYRLLSYDYVGLGFNLVTLSKVYLQKGNIAQASYYLHRSDSLAASVSFPPDLIYNQLAVQRDLFEKQKRFREAADISQKMIRQREAILNSEKQEVIASYEVRFGVNELERALEIEASNRRKNNLIYTLSSMLGAFIIFFLIYYNYVKQKDAKKNEIRYKEMHHRIKNNLSLLSGMINHKRIHLKDGMARKALQSIGKQLDAINLIMQGLYFSKTANSGQLDFGKYLKGLIQNLFGSIGIGNEQYKIVSNLDPVLLTAEQSNPLGLVANEVLTNIIKYGQNKDGTWTVKIDLHEKDDLVELCIKDYGPGFKTQDLVKTETHGMNLIDLLVRQLKGEYSYAGDNGGNFTVCFKK